MSDQDHSDDIEGTGSAEEPGPQGDWDPSDHRLPVWATIREAAQALAKERKALLKIAVPALLILAVSLAASPFGLGIEPLGDLLLPLVWLGLLLGLLVPVGLSMMIAVSCHRLLILGPDSLPNAWGLFWSWRETRFLGWMFGIYFLVQLLDGEWLWQLGVVTQNALVFLDRVSVPLALYVGGRLSLVLPATAIGERPTLKGSGQLTRSNGWRLALVLSPAVLLAVLQGVLIRALNDSAVVAAADYFLRQGLIFALVLSWVFGFALLSKAYCWFTAEIEPSTPS